MDSTPAFLTDALGVVHGKISPEVQGRTRSVFTAVGGGADINVAVWSRKSSLTSAGLGTAVAIRVGVVTASRTVSRALRGFDNSCHIDVTTSLEIAVVIITATVNWSLIGWLVSGSNTSSVVTPCFIGGTSVLSTPNIFAVMLTANKTIVATVSPSNTQIDFVFGPTISNNGITEFDDPILGKVSAGEGNTVGIIGNDGKRIALLGVFTILSDLVKTNELGRERASFIAIVPDFHFELRCTSDMKSSSVYFEGPELRLAKNSPIVSISIFFATVNTNIVWETKKIGKLIGDQ